MKDHYLKLTKRNKILFSLGSVLGLSLFIFGIALAVNFFTIDNIDGIWTTIDGGDGATCDRWATCSAPTTCSGISNSWWDQTPPSTDENQVRYGYGSGTTNCSSGTPQGFYTQSGFGFNGEDYSSFMPAFNTPFPLGQFTHYNHEIMANNALNYVDLPVDVPVTCPTGTTGSETLNITYRFTLDETDNDPPCEYHGTTECPDKVTVLNTGGGGDNLLECVGDPELGGGQYTIQVLGFVPGDCDPNPCGGTVSNEYITEENQSNLACLCGKVTEYTPTAVEMEYFMATFVNGNDVLISWKTLSEIDNAGFNLYRGQSQDGSDKALIASVPAKNPGVFATSGEYEYLDEGLAGNGTYYYWLGAVNLDYFEEPVDQTQAVSSEHQLEQLPERFNDWRDWVLKWLEYRQNPNE